MVDFFLLRSIKIWPYLLDPLVASVRDYLCNIFFFLVGRLNVHKLMLNVVGSAKQITLSFIKFIRNYSKYSRFIVDKRPKQRKHFIDYFADWKIHKIWKPTEIHYGSGFQIWNRADSSHVEITSNEWFVSICCMFWFVSVRR